MLSFAFLVLIVFFLLNLYDEIKKSSKRQFCARHVQGLDNAVVYDQLRQLVRGMRLVVPFEPSPVPIAHGVLVDHLPDAYVRALRHDFLSETDFHGVTSLFQVAIIDTVSAVRSHKERKPPIVPCAPSHFAAFMLYKV